MGAPDKDPKGLGVSWVIPSKPHLVSGDRKLHLLQARLAGTVFTFRGLSVIRTIKAVSRRIISKDPEPSSFKRDPWAEGTRLGPCRSSGHRAASGMLTHSLFSVHPLSHRELRCLEEKC